MKVVEIQGAFGLDHLALAERPEPEPGPGEVVIDVRAAWINNRKFQHNTKLWRQTAWKDSSPRPAPSGRCTT